MTQRVLHVAGSGLLALDVVLANDNSPEALTFAGGTCGNVLAILSYLNCTTSAIGYVGGDAAGRRMLSDLTAVGVQARHLQVRNGHTTPIFVQSLYQDATGRPTHQFSQQCPSCGHALAPKSSKQDALPVRDFPSDETLDAFFMDRLSADTVALAASAKSRGALVVYEPSAASDAPYWSDALPLVDVLKYSADRFASDDLAAFLTSPRPSPLWEVQTLGARGLRYREHSPGKATDHDWQELPALPAPRLVDTCGAGDWCTAGLVYGLFAIAEPEPRVRFAKALVQGQAMAAWACAFVGARGAMYCSDEPLTWWAVRELVRGETIDPSRLPSVDRLWQQRHDDLSRCWHDRQPQS